MDYYKYSKIFQVGPRGSGRTYAICHAAQSINAIVMVANLTEVDRLRNLYDIEAVSVDQMLKGFQGPVLADHSAMLEICQRYEDRVNHLMEKNTELRGILLEQGYPHQTKPLEETEEWVIQTNIDTE